LILGADVFVGLCILLALYANDRSENADACAIDEARPKQAASRFRSTHP
jgi:hypothetical protein